MTNDVPPIQGEDPQGRDSPDGEIHDAAVAIFKGMVGEANEESARQGRRQPIYWLQTYTGRKIDLINPTSEMVDIEDIAHSLSMICRFNGHCRDFYSVAEHSVMVESNGSEIWMSHESERPSDQISMRLHPPRELMLESLCLLLHDAAEAYIGDLTTPLKRGLDSIGAAGFSPIGELERRWLMAIGQAFGLGGRLAEPSVLMQRADERVMVSEVTSLFHPVQSCWWDTRARPRSAEMMIHCWPPAEARRQFLGRFRVLYEALYSKTGWSEVGGAKTGGDHGGREEIP